MHSNLYFKGSLTPDSAQRQFDLFDKRFKWVTHFPSSIGVPLLVVAANFQQNLRYVKHFTLTISENVFELLKKAFLHYTIVFN